ncbi:inorganic phosphate transporter [Candidatus Formimonas warabiya]|uniref:Anion permease n=1 Tax=Formimonas warabiya TaxID=1761012 RepID=A0A3G1KTE6_FORW1|nr:inorganic phosphate transporter [Candidatus Formimonas warabiya]ATW25707.1 anion permease [Candidatus Formimonas warabiya]
MLDATLWITIVVVGLALTFDFINGFHDTANSIATSVSTRVLSPAAAIMMAASLNFLGAFISVKVAKTVGADIVNPGSIPQTVVIATLLGAITWNLITWYFGLPSSSSHALIGGLLGSAIAFKGSLSIVHWSNFFDKVLLWLILSPCIGFAAGFILMTLLNRILRSVRPVTVTKVFSKAQIFSAALMALNHGGNDAQKSMGIITMALLSGGLIPQFEVPLWVKVACALVMAAGTSVGGWKIIKTMGMNMARLAPVNGFAAETGAAAVIFTATMFHSPVSTTHIISSSIMGVGAAKRLSCVRWVVAKNIVWAWVLTIPITATISGIISYLIKLIF